MTRGLSTVDRVDTLLSKLSTFLHHNCYTLDQNVAKLENEANFTTIKYIDINTIYFVFESH